MDDFKIKIDDCIYKMSRQDIREEIRKVSKNFLDDQDDPWMVYLNVDINHEIRAKRMEFHNQFEILDQLRQRVKDTKGDASIKKELKEAEKVLKILIADLAPKLRKWKELGKRSAADEINSNPIFKRARTEDYVSKSGERSGCHSDSNIIYGSTPQKNPTSSNQSTVPQVQQDTLESLLEGVERSRDRAILTDLKTLIFRYQCRDRVMKALKSINKREQDLKSLESMINIRYMRKKRFESRAQ